MTDKKVMSFHATVVKDINEQLVLNLVQEHNIISSSELVKLTGMRPSTIFNILKELSAKDFITFYGKGESTVKGGKKPYIWALNQEAAYSIGVDIEVGEMTIVVMNFGRGVVARKLIKLDTGKNADELADSIKKVVNDVIEENKIDTGKILGLAVAIAGIVDFKNGLVTMSSVLPEMNIPLLSKLKDLPFPVVLENNANAAAIGLKRNGDQAPKKNYIAILIEIDKHVSGLGIGIVINGEIYRGSSFCAGELYPHLPTLTEILSSVRSRFVESEILKDYIDSYDTLTLETLLQAAKDGDEIATLVFSMVGDMVGKTIAPAVALLNPDSLIITGVVAELEDIIIKPLRKVIDLRVISITSNALNIFVDKYHQYSVAYGAATVILENFFRLPIST